MQPSLLVARADKARKEIAQATAELAAKAGIQANNLDAYQHRDPAINSMLQLEAIALVLKELAVDPLPAMDFDPPAASKPRGRPRKESIDGTL